MSEGYSHQFFALCIQETFEDTKGVTKAVNQTDKQQNGQRKLVKTNNDLHHINRFQTANVRSEMTITNADGNVISGLGKTQT